jgi:hypothetical protein
VLPLCDGSIDNAARFALKLNLLDITGLTCGARLVCLAGAARRLCISD